MFVEFSPEPPVADLALRTAEFIRETVIPVEEAKLEEAFHDEYKQYRKRVRRWF